MSQSLNKTQLQQLQGTFLMEYPQGFADPKMQLILKKHPIAKMTALARDSFPVSASGNVHSSAQHMAKIVSRSSMVSMFEKPKFKSFINSLNEYDKAFLVDSLLEFLHADQQRGFEGMLQVLATEKLAKWSLISIIPAYYAPDSEVFIKPTTVKNILRHFNITELVYKPTPSWDFYQRYRELINTAKTKVHPSLTPNNPAFCGFLMMTTKT
ncbi:hypothetical protein A9R01_03375 ['Osedax' symbiont bacterium Rs2_46_30_T18]|nr:hypothetical protein A9R01_03375 ['Osedax' symbiont bacterium Rs2_46_30_T18]